MLSVWTARARIPSRPAQGGTAGQSPAAGRHCDVRDRHPGLPPCSTPTRSTPHRMSSPPPAHGQSRRRRDRSRRPAGRRSSAARTAADPPNGPPVVEHSVGQSTDSAGATGQSWLFCAPQPQPTRHRRSAHSQSSVLTPPLSARPTRSRRVNKPGSMRHRGAGNSETGEQHREQRDECGFADSWVKPLLAERGWRSAEGPRRTADIPWTRDSRREHGL